MTPFSFDFEQHALTEEQMKELIYREALAFNPEYQRMWVTEVSYYSMISFFGWLPLNGVWFDGWMNEWLIPSVHISPSLNRMAFSLSVEESRRICWGSLWKMICIGCLSQCLLESEANPLLITFLCLWANIKCGIRPYHFNSFFRVWIDRNHGHTYSGLSAGTELLGLSACVLPRVLCWQWRT